MNLNAILMVGGIASAITLPFAIYISHQYGILAGFLYGIVMSFAITWIVIERKRGR